MDLPSPRRCRVEQTAGDLDVGFEPRRASVAGHFSAEDQFGFEAASWYWHFVDVVWVGLFLFVYIL
jgi:heme/copper-type cytochrome/quinol oxidase subunit 3